MSAVRPKHPPPPHTQKQIKFSEIAATAGHAPASRRLISSPVRSFTVEERTKVQQATEYNVFAFPADMLVVDMLSDSGTTAMMDMQWAAMFHGDESYGRNRGYYALLDAIRDTFERGDDPKMLYKHILTPPQDNETIINDTYLATYEGGLVNGGAPQLERPNAFLVPQGRCGENLLFGTLSQVLAERDGPGKHYTFISNGWFDTTGAHVKANGFEALNLMKEDLIKGGKFNVDDIDRINPFLGNMDIEALETALKTKESVPLIVLTITNNTAAGQPVSLENMRAVKQVADKYKIPLFYDACRFAENAAFIKEFEAGYADRSIQSIVQECFTLCDGFTISFKKDGLANIGGGLFFRDRGVFATMYSLDSAPNIGIRIKEQQILQYGNDSYGALSGRDIMALTIGLYQVVSLPYLRERILQVRYLAASLARKGVPVVLPPGGHAVYIDMDPFFEGTDMATTDFGGVGLSLELIRLFGIRGCELGPFAFESELQSEEAQKSIKNFVRFAVPRNVYSREHMDYVANAVATLHNHRTRLPKVRVVRGKELRLRHFQSGLMPVFPEE